MKRLLPILFFLVLLFWSPLFCFGSGSQLRTIGAMSVDGVTYDHLWYTSGNITFTGIAIAEATVEAIIDGASETVTADASGDWSYSTSLAGGDHTVNFTSNESTIPFTLTVGEVPEGVGGLSTSETPTAGVIEPTVFVFVFGVGLALLPFVLRKVFA